MTFPPMRSFSIRFMDTSGDESQTFDLLTPHQFGRDGTFDDVPTDEIVFYQRH